MTPPPVEVATLWVPGTRQSVRDFLVRSATRTADTGVTDLKAYILPARDSLISAALKETPAMTEETPINGRCPYLGEWPALEDAPDALVVGTDYWVVTACSGYRSEARKVHYGYFLPSIFVAVP